MCFEKYCLVIIFFAHFSDNVDRRTTARMPWHDIAVAVQGSAARDVARHFIQRWNAIKTEKAKFSKQYPYLVPRSYANSCRKPPAFSSIHLKTAAHVKCQVLRSGCQWSIGISKTENSILLAYLNAIQGAKYYIYIENQFFITSSTKSGDSLSTSPSDTMEEIKNKVGRALVDKVIEAHKEGRTFRIFILLPLLPAFEAESTGIALRTILHFNYTSICRGTQSLFSQILAEGINPSNYISICSLRNHGELLGTLVTELIYIHSKLLIVDDRLVICGSANINDRSFLGSRDSEVAVILEDTVFENGVMDGEKAPFGKFAGTLRQKLMQEHLAFDTVKDCISETFYKDIWLRRASKNTKLYEEIFDCFPSDKVTTLEENQTGNKRPLAERDKYLSLQKIQEIQGNLVLLPLNYLSEVNLLPSVFAKEGLVPTITWT